MLLNGGIMVFNATFNNISVISWRSVLLVEETGVHGSRNPPTCRKSRTNFITYCGIEYTSPKTGYDHDHDGPLNVKINKLKKKGRYKHDIASMMKNLIYISLNMKISTLYLNMFTQNMHFRILNLYEPTPPTI